MFHCVWQAIHLNVPPTGETVCKQIFRRIGWSVPTVVAPELVTLNAWCVTCEFKLEFDL
jgi:hypothetical protein